MAAVSVGAKMPYTGVLNIIIVVGSYPSSYTTDVYDTYDVSEGGYTSRDHSHDDGSIITTLE